MTTMTTSAPTSPTTGASAALGPMNEARAPAMRAATVGDAVVRASGSRAGRPPREPGRRGRMPNPRGGKGKLDVAKAVKEAKGGKIEFRAEKAGIVHAPVGKSSFPAEKLAENFNVLIDLVMKLKPATAKGVYLKSITVSSTMGPGVKIDTQEINARFR